MTTTTAHTTTFDTAALVRAIESRDADALSGLYAPDATLTMLDRDHPPAAPLVLSGRDAIETYFRDICGRNIEHTVRRLVADEDTVAYEQHCQYPEGPVVVCLAVASVSGGLIRQLTGSQTWDD